MKVEMLVVVVVRKDEHALSFSHLRVLQGILDLHL